VKRNRIERENSEIYVRSGCRHKNHSTLKVIHGRSPVSDWTE
jgi:hypothetical protein